MRVSDQRDSPWITLTQNGCRIWETTRNSAVPPGARTMVSSVSLLLWNSCWSRVATMIYEESRHLTRLECQQLGPWGSDNAGFCQGTAQKKDCFFFFFFEEGENLGMLSELRHLVLRLVTWIQFSRPHTVEEENQLANCLLTSTWVCGCMSPPQNTI